MVCKGASYDLLQTLYCLQKGFKYLDSARRDVCCQPAFNTTLTDFDATNRNRNRNSKDRKTPIRRKCIKQSSDVNTPLQLNLPWFVPTEMH